MSDPHEIIQAMKAEAEGFAQNPDRQIIAATIIAERDSLVAALRRLQSHHAVATYNNDLMRRMVLLQGIIGGYGRSDEATIIRALAQLASIRRETLSAVGQTRRRKADHLAARVRQLAVEGLTAREIAGRVDRSESSVRRLLARAGGR